MPESYSIDYMYHFFICLSIDAHLGLLHILAIVNKGAVNISTHISFELVFWFSSDKYLAMELLHPSLSLIIAFVLKSILYCVSIATPAFFCFHFHEISFSFLYFQFVCVFLYEVSHL